MDILALILCICQVKKWIALYFFLTIVISIDFIEPHKLKSSPAAPPSRQKNQQRDFSRHCLFCAFLKFSAALSVFLFFLQINSCTTHCKTQKHQFRIHTGTAVSGLHCCIFLSCISLTGSLSIISGCSIGRNICSRLI